MKTKKVVLTMVAAIVASSFAFAGASASRVAVLNQNNSGVYKLIYEGATAGKVSLKIYDNSSNVIFSETKSGLSKFILPLNFTGLEHGEYSIEITDETGTQIQKVNYASTETVTAAAKAVHITKLQDGKYLMSAATNGNINVQIFDGNDNLIHSDNLVVNGRLGLVYNLQGVQGQPTFLVR
jgi:hypothetical protein